MSRSKWRSTLLHTAPDALLETGIRRLYPYLKSWRNPMALSVKGRAVKMRHGGEKAHFFAAYQCFQQGQYEIPAPLFAPAVHTEAAEAHYHALVGKGLTPLIVDCGANIGASALWFAARYPAARIVAVEPASSNVQLLRDNVAGLDAVVMHGAVGPTAGTSRLSGSDRSPMSFQVRTDGNGPEVQVFDLPSLLEAAGDATPFILKVDIEGGEASLFATEHDVLARFPVIIVEPHDFTEPGKAPSGSFLAFHAARARDFLFSKENIFSIDYPALVAG